MRDPDGLYDLSIDVSQVPRGLHLVAGLTGFSDAGSAVTQLGAVPTPEALWRAPPEVDQSRPGGDPARPRATARAAGPPAMTSSRAGKAAA